MYMLEAKIKKNQIQNRDFFLHKIFKKLFWHKNSIDKIKIL